MDTIIQRHGLLKKHHEQTKELEVKQLTNLHKYEATISFVVLRRIASSPFRMRHEFTSKQHQTELVNFNEYSNRRQKDLVKRHALSQKQFPKNIKVMTRSFVDEMRIDSESV